MTPGPGVEGRVGHVRRGSWGAASRIACTGAALSLALVVLRAQAAFGWSDLRDPSGLIRRLAVAAYSDLAYVASITLLAAGLALAVRRWPALERAVALAFTVLACGSLLLGLVNVRAVAELGRPINYQWLYYSHFMRSMDSYTALAALLTWRWVAQVAGACILLVGGSALARRLLVRAVRPGTGLQLATAAVVLLGAYFVLTRPAHARVAGSERARMENPVAALAASVLSADANPVLAEMPTAAGTADFLTAAERGGQSPRTPFTGRAREAGVRNVLVIVLESVGAAYVSGFGGSSTTTPTLERYRAGSRRFTAIYSHQPSTTHSLVALLLAVFPPNTFRTVTREHADISLPSWSGELKRRGYRTAFVNAGDNRFQSEDAFLAHRQFDLVADGWTSPCSDPEVERLGQDACMMRALGTWVDRDRSRPFFAAVWTIQTHFPYVVSRSGPRPKSAGLPLGAEGRPDADSLPVRYGRYLAALQETDRAIGTLLDGWAARGLLDSTLVVVVGDHGEAFGQHGNMAHRYLYEEEVRVPLVLINRRLFGGEGDTVPGGIIDIGPTVMDLLGDSIPAPWQGRSLFSPDRSGRVYLFGPYSGLFGLREGGRKLIYDAIGGETELYDLAADPGEKSNLAGQKPESVREGRERLAAWFQYQNGFYKRVLGGAGNGP